MQRPDFIDPDVYLTDALSSFPTPPSSRSPEEVHTLPATAEQEASVSTAFPNFAQKHLAPNNHAPDALMLSSDLVYFYVHQRQLGLGQPSSALLHQTWVPSKGALCLAEPSVIVNSMLHILYGYSSRDYEPSVEIIGQSFAALMKYGYELSSLVQPNTEIFNQLVFMAERASPTPRRKATAPVSLNVYTLAASYQLEALARETSPYALGTALSAIDEQTAMLMGPVYLLRLAQLQQSRIDALKGLLLRSPPDHEPTPTCTNADMRTNFRAYALAAAYLAWEVVPHADQQWIEDGFRVLLKMDCVLCQQSLRTTIQDILAKWREVPATI